MKVLLTVFCFFALPHLYGQRVITKIAKDICNCSNELDIPSLDSAAAVRSMKDCLSHMIYYSEGLKKKQIDILDSNDLDLLSDKVMTKLFKCESFIELSLAMEAFSLKKPNSKVEDTKACEVFRNGKFLMQDTQDSTIVWMNNTEQLVKNLEDGTYSKYSVTWVSDCKYMLTYINGNKKSIKRLAKRLGPTKVEIISVNGDIITFLSTMANISFESKMKKLE